MTQLLSRLAALEPEKRALMAQRFPLSFAQRRLWFLAQLDPQDASYNVPAALRLRGELRPGALAAALETVVHRHAVLRTSFPAFDGEPLQLIAPPAPVPLPRVDLAGLARERREAEAVRLAEAVGGRPFDLARGPLLRAALLHLGERDHAFLLNLHHAVCDGWSRNLLLRELTALYAARVAGRGHPLPALELGYVDYARWQRRWLESESFARQLAYWRRRLEGSPPRLELPYDRPAAAGGGGGGWRERPLDPAVAAAAEATGRRRSASPFMVGLAAFAALLYRDTGQTDLPVGTPVVRRPLAETEGLVGPFLNMLVLRLEVDPGAPFGDLLEAVRDVVLDAFEHQDLPFEKLVDALDPERLVGANPLFQVMFTNLVIEPASARFGGLELSPLEVQARPAKYDLSLFVNSFGELGWRAAAEYAPARFDATTVERLLRRYGTLLAAALERPDRAVRELPVLTPQERWQVVGEANDSAWPLPAATLHRLLARRARETPEAVALRGLPGSGAVYTYGALLRAWRGLAAVLRRHGVGPGRPPVGLSVERSPEMVVALLAILEAGGSYLPLDPAFPADRLRWMARDAAVELVLTEGDGVAEEPAGDFRELSLARALAEAEGEAGGTAGEPDADHGVDPLAYVLYTSGSTGRPKGVQVGHRAAVNFLRSMVRWPGLERGDVLLAVTTLSFDIALLELLGPLLAGAQVVVAGRREAADGFALAELVESCGATVMQATPSTWRMLLDTGWRPRPGLRLLCGGEPLPPDLARRLTEPGARLWNLYGPTETTVWSSVSEVTRPVTEIDVGWPVDNTSLHVLDRRLEPVGLGLHGELWIGGEGLARGYLGRPGLTADRFRPDPFTRRPGGRLYRTGDLARRLAGGRLEHLGRTDGQVKVRGFRVEPGEVEAALLDHPAVSRAAVVVPDGDQRLVAYWCAEDGADPPPPASELRRLLARRLPAYMVPSVFRRLPELPSTPNRKVDRRALAAAPVVVEAAGGGASGGRVEPRDPVEEALTRVWAELLEVPRVGIHDGFFELGGHSLLATRVMARVHQLFAVQVPLRHFFESPTVAALASAVRRAMRGGAEGPPAPTLAPVGRDRELPLSFAQQRMWVLEQMAPGSPTYHVHTVLRLQGELRPGALRAAFAAVVARHEALRTTFPAEAGRPLQRPTGASRRLPLPTVDVAALGPGRAGREGRRLTAREVRRPFDLAAGPLVRLVLVRAPGREHRLAITLHHIVCDGWAMGVFVRDLVELYRAALAGEAPALPALPVQYPDFAVWQRRSLEGPRLESLLGHWRHTLDGAPTVLDLPTDRPRGRVAAGRGGEIPWRLSRSRVAALEALGRRREATLFMVLLSGLAAVLGRHARQRDVVLGTPVAQRDRVELEHLVGTFVNALPLRLDLSGATSFAELVSLSRGVCLDAYAHQDLPFERLVEDLQPPASAAATPVFQAVLALQNVPGGRLRVPGLEVTRQRLDGGSAKFDLTLVVADAGDRGLAGKLVYDAGLFDRTTARRLGRHLDHFLEAACGRSEAPWSELPLLSAAERHQLHLEWPASRPGATPAGDSLHRRVAERSAAAPHAIAVSASGTALSYGELDRRCGALAGELRRRGVGPEVRVALFFERGVEMVVAVLGVLRAGGAYVPVDPDSPAQRTSYLLADSGAALLVSQRHLSDRLPAGAGDVLWLEDVALGPAAAPAPPAPVDLDNTAYVIYTSGSTGRPKGVPVSHRNVLRLFDSTDPWFAFSADDVWSLFHSYAFDFSVWEMFGALLHGGRLEVVPYWLSRSPRDFWDRLAAAGVTMLSQTPSAFYPLAGRATEETAPAAPALRCVVFGGEALDPSALTGWWRCFGDRRPVLVNMFGITETTVHVTYRRLDAAFSRGHARSYVGRAIPDLAVSLLDPWGAPVPIGVAGEIHVAGPGLSRGYLGRPALTAQRFVPAAAGGRPGERSYRSGDLGRYRGDGELEYLGRMDDQVKIRGFRIELGEVRAALQSHPAVRDAAVVLRDDGPAGGRLVAYVVAGGGVEGSDLKLHAGASLPPYMVPEAVVFLDALPLTGNGKLDRRRLPPPGEAAVGEDAGEPAATPSEERVAAVFAEILDLDPAEVGRRADFFALGGHSLLAAQAAHRLSTEWGRRLELRVLFECPTVAELALALDQLRRGEAAPPPLEPRPPAEPPVLSLAQERLWFLERAEGGGAYNIPLPMTWEGPVDPGALRRAVGELERRHEVLRTAVEVESGRPVARLRPPRLRPLPLLDLAALDAGPGEAEARRLALREAAAPFDLAADPPLRLRLVRLGRHRHLLLATLHHVAGDGGSVALLVGELAALYTAARNRRPSPLPRLPLQYADFAAWQRRWLSPEVLERQLAYWRRTLGRRLPRLDLPLDRQAAAAGRRRGGRVPVAVGEPVLRGLRDLARRRGATLFMTLVAAFDAWLWQLTGQTDLVVGTNVAGRDQPATRPLVGCFVNQLVLRADLSGDPSFEELVERVRRVTLAAYDHQDLPYHALVAELRPEKEEDRGRLYQAKVELLDRTTAQADGRRAAGDVEVAPYPLGRPVVRYDLHLVMAEDGDGLRGSLQYDAGRFHAATATAMARDLAALLTAASGRPGLRMSQLEDHLNTDRRRREGETRDRQRSRRARSLRRLRRSAAEAVPLHD